MPSMMAIVSKAVFEKAARGKGVGDVWATDSYVSQKLGALAGGDLYLVTVRPGDVLWLVGVLAKPTFDGTAWRATNTQPIRDISALKTGLTFANGLGLPAKAGALGMSLQTARVLTDDDLALLGGDVEAAPPPTTKTPANTPTKTTTLPTTTDTKTPANKPAKTKRLDAARDDLRAGHGDRALAKLVEVWADEPSPQLAELITALSTEVRTPAPANLRGKTAAARAAWDAHAATATAADRPMLLESLCDVASGDALERLAVVEGWMPDPRIDVAFVEILRETPYRATSTKPFWTKLFALAEQIREPAQKRALAALDYAGVAVTMAQWLKTKTAKLVAALPETSQLDTRPILDELAQLVGGTRAAGAAERADLEQMFQAVYDAPEDDGVLAVLADALIERGDLRGELITVQLGLARDPRDRALKQRERALLDAHGRGWLGDLEPIVMADARFERGFLSACKVDDTHLDRVRALVGHPAWSTVRSLEGSALIGLHPVMRSLRRLVFVQGRAELHEQVPGAWRDLLLDTPRAIEDLEYESLHVMRTWLDTAEGRRQVEISEVSEVDALCTCTALPQLRRLTLRDNPVLFVGKLARAPVLARLASLGFHYDRNNRFEQGRASALVDFTQILADARVPELRFVIGSFHETELVLERGAQGYERARMTLGPTVKSNWSGQLVSEAIRMLDSLPRTLRELRVTTRKSTEAEQVDRLRAAATRMALDVVEID